MASAASTVLAGAVWPEPAALNRTPHGADAAVLPLAVDAACEDVGDRVDLGCRQDGALRQGGTRLKTRAGIDQLLDRGEAI